LVIALNASNGATVRALWDGHASMGASEADAALVARLACYTQDPEQLARLWMASPLGQRGKVQERADYRERTISKALSVLTKTYQRTPQRGMRLESW